MKRQKLCGYINRQMDEVAAASWLEDKSFKKGKGLFSGFEESVMYGYGV